MTCYRSHDANGNFVGILCGKFGKPCVECGDVSAVLCDFPLGDVGETCDLPLCERCAPTVGANKNYCKEHRENGPGLLLFRPKPLTEEEMRERAKKVIEATKTRARRLPKAPSPNLRWRVLQGDRAGGHSVGAALTDWMSQIAAEVYAKRVGGTVQTWDQFVVQWRKRWPTQADLKALEKHKKSCGGCPKCMPHVEGCAGCPWCLPTMTSPA